MTAEPFYSDDNVTTEPSESGTRTEYAIRYDAPGACAGKYDRADSFDGAARMAQVLNALVDVDLRCIVVAREVTYGEWTEA